jgi:small-conductance mechanosensitive channel
VRKISIKEILNNNIYVSIIYILLGYIAISVLKKIFKNIQKKNNQIYIKFLKNVFQGFIVIFVFFQVGNKFDSIRAFTTTILTSSSLLVVVLGFAFQESLADFISGFLISIFKPFNTNDRVHLINSNISGTIETITIRHTVIRTFSNSRVIIPNSIMNKEKIENSHIIDAVSGNFVDIEVEYDTDLEKAKRIITEVILSHPNVIDMRSEEDKKNKVPQVNIFLKEFTTNGICLRTTVWTDNIDSNFQTCSDIRYEIIKRFNIEHIGIPYSHQTIELSENSLKQIKEIIDSSRKDFNENKTSKK